MIGKRYKEGGIVPNKCQECAFWEDTDITISVEGLPVIGSAGVCKNWLGLLTYGYYGDSPIKEICPEFKQY